MKRGPPNQAKRNYKNQKDRNPPKPKRTAVFVGLGSVLLVAGFVAVLKRHNGPPLSQTDKPIVSVTESNVAPSALASRPEQPKSLHELLTFSAEQLEQVDLVVMNLLCAEGLRGAENLDVQFYLNTIDSWAGHVASETQRSFHKFAANPRQFDGSLGYYRMMALATVLQLDLGAHYKPERAVPQLRGEWEPSDVFFADSKDVFLHGLLSGEHAGTCSSLPVLYVAVAQRLGYPVHLAAAKGHFYVRYEEGTKHLNVEASGIGFNTYPDEHYRRWPFPTSDEEARTYGLFRPMSKREILV